MFAWCVEPRTDNEIGGVPFYVGVCWLDVSIYTYKTLHKSLPSRRLLPWLSLSHLWERTACNLGSFMSLSG